METNRFGLLIFLEIFSVNLNDDDHGDLNEMSADTDNYEEDSEEYFIANNY